MARSTVAPSAHLASLMNSRRLEGGQAAPELVVDQGRRDVVAQVRREIALGAVSDPLIRQLAGMGGGGDHPVRWGSQAASRGLSAAAATGS
jgi:hypothetical protein